MKRVFWMALMCVLMSGAIGVTAFAEKEDAVKVYVTISDDEGNLVMTQEEVTVTDVDGDGAFTIHDALYAAHEAKYEGGAEEGYASYTGDYGLSLSKLWGVENGGSYGYCVNNNSAMSLADVVADGDYINAYVYTDLTTWSDTYCYFDANTISVESDKEVSLVLSAASYDSKYNPITIAVENAAITINGEATDFTTDAEGKVVIALEKEGTYVISAVSETQTLVPPVCIVTVTETGTANAVCIGITTIIIIIVCVVALGAFIGYKKSNKKK